jgi:hypothetical protein
LPIGIALIPTNGKKRGWAMDGRKDHKPGEGVVGGQGADRRRLRVESVDQIESVAH